MDDDGETPKRTVFQILESLILRIGGQGTFVTLHLFGTALGAYMTRVPALLARQSRVPKTFSRGSSFAWFLVVIFLVDVAAYTFVVFILTENGDKRDIDLTSALFVGSLMGSTIAAWTQWIATRSNVFWKPDDDKQPLGGPLVANYSVTIFAFMLTPWLAISV